MSKKVIKMNESVLRSLIKESVNRVLREQDEYDWNNLDQDRKDFENHLSWRNKEEVDANDRAISKGSSPKSIAMSDDEHKRWNKYFERKKDTRPDAKMHWDWGYKSGIEPFSFEKKSELIDLGDKLDAHTDLMNGEEGMDALKYPDFHRAFYGGEKLNESYINRIVKESVNAIGQDEAHKMAYQVIERALIRTFGRNCVEGDGDDFITIDPDDSGYGVSVKIGYIML